MEMLYQRVAKLLRSSNKTLEQRNKEIKFILINEDIDENCAININLYMCKYCIDTYSHTANWNMLYFYFYIIKKKKFKSNDFCTTLFTIAQLLYLVTHYKYHSLIFHFLLLAYNNKYRSIIYRSIDLLLRFSLNINNKLQYFYINKLIQFIADGFNRNLINTNNNLYKDFCIMFPNEVNKLNSLILLNKLDEV